MSLIIQRLRIPCGTISIYALRLYHRRKYKNSNIRYLHNFTMFNLLNFTNVNSSPVKTASDNSSLNIICNEPPKIRTKWFYATDVPNSQPDLYNYTKTKEPRKFLPFSDQDSDRIENQWQNLLHDNAVPIPGFESHMVPVLEDRLFECDLLNLEIKPIYWDGAHYEIRRGVWFDKENMPLPNHVSDALEELFIEIAPFSKDFDKIDDTMSLTKRFAQKTAVFTKENSVYLLDNNSTFTSFQVKYLIKSVIPPLLPVEKFSRGYKKDVSKEKVNKSENAKKPLETPKYQQEIRDDYSNKNDDYSNNRDIEHLVICVHGIGQVLGTKYESINFIHTINQLRQSMKKVFKSNESLQKIAYPDSPEELDNCKIQVLPIVWRHHLKLNSQRKIDGDVSLSDITIDGLRPLRDMLGDIVLDVLLYYEPYYMNQILKQVTEEINQVYDTYKEKNPNFHGKVSLVGHSLGSAICLDILCNTEEPGLKFDVENFFAIGSPIGVFCLLKNSSIVPRNASYDPSMKNLKSPKVGNFYNIFHPCDPVAYRVEPLICQKFADYKPALIPFASNNIDAQLQNLTQISDQLTTKVIENINVALQTITPQATTTNETEQPEEQSQVSHKDLEIMTQLNYSGRVDYSLPLGIFDISIVSLINSHVSYFDEPNISGFLLRELLLSKKKSVKDKSVTLLEKNPI